MNQRLRTLFPYLALGLLLAGLSYAVSFGRLPPADFTFNNDDEIRTVDPATATGQPEHRIIAAVFEGLLRQLPMQDPPADPDGVIPLEPMSACAASFQVSDDGKTYTFNMRPEARWSNGDPVTAYDFAWSWRRTLHPETAAEYAYQLHYIAGAKNYNTSEVTVGEHVEVELADRRDPNQPFPRGEIVRGILDGIDKPPEPKLADDASKEERSKADTQWRKAWVYRVRVAPPMSADGKESPSAAGQFPNDDQPLDWDQAATIRRFSKQPVSAESTSSDAKPLERCAQVLPDFATTVGIRTPDPLTLIITLNNSTPYFPELLAFYPYFPVHRGCVEQYGTPDWTKPKNIVSNGPFTLQERRIRDRIRLVKNERYWNADQVPLNVIDALAVKYQTTALNMYLNGQLDWIIKPPPAMLEELRQRGDLITAPALITYFYRLNTARKPLDDVRVRRALNMALDKQAICEGVTRGGERPARHLVPPGMRGYTPALGGEFNVAEAQRLLAEAGFPNGQGFPRLHILFNTHDAHRDIAEVIQQQWKTNLGIDIELRNLEWGVYLTNMNKIDFDICRAGWIPDYPDPNTFLDMFVTGGAHNNTNWSNPQYDHLIEQAGAETNPAARMKLLGDAERILMDEQPILPIYFYVTINMVHPRVRNFSPNSQDVHPLQVLQMSGPAGRPLARPTAATPSAVTPSPATPSPATPSPATPTRN
ncbi:MAG: peptide ABC transporter substrate-binding protein [Planctomycetota bacterium]